MTHSPVVSAALSTQTGSGESAQAPSNPPFLASGLGALPLDQGLRRPGTRLAESARRRFAYLHQGRRLVSLVGAVACLPVGLLLGLPVAVANAVFYRDVRRIFFRQARVGRDGRVFQIWKFRTMRDAPEEEAEREASQELDDLERYEFERWAEGRGEVTKLGKFLRDSHLDELPQLINVLAGDMDLVGPRPEMLEVHRWAKSVVPGFHRRNQTRPGITGLAQLSHGYARKSVDAYRLKLDADLEYIRSASLVGDVVLMLRTVPWISRLERKEKRT